MENKYFFRKSERTWAHELTSQMGGELMSWSPSVSAALVGRTSYFLNNGIYYHVIHHIEAKTVRNALASWKTKKIQHVGQKLTFHLF